MNIHELHEDNIEELYGELIIPNEYEVKVKEWLNNDDEMYSHVKRQVLKKQGLLI